VIAAVMRQAFEQGRIYEDKFWQALCPLAQNGLYFEIVQRGVRSSLIDKEELWDLFDRLIEFGTPTHRHVCTLLRIIESPAEDDHCAVNH